MTADLTNNVQLCELRRVGIPIPENHGDTYELSHEEEMILYADWHTTTKADLLDYIDSCRECILKFPTETLEMGMNPDDALIALDRMKEVVIENPWNYAPDGFWYFYPHINRGALVLVLVKDKGNFNNQLHFIPDGVAETILLYSINGKDFSEERFVSLYNLSETERAIIEFRLGLVDGKASTTEEIADLIGITPEEVLEREKNAMESLTKINVHY
ncbi:MAG: sigma factor-like helix-turn-helix DNA-binding protein [Oscillospiraceae bacterium]